MCGQWSAIHGGWLGPALRPLTLVPMGGHMALVPTESGHAPTLESGSPGLNEKIRPSIPNLGPVSFQDALGSVSGQAALPSRNGPAPWVPWASPAHLGAEGSEGPDTHVVL